jgi:hypothetical protein
VVIKQLSAVPETGIDILSPYSSKIYKLVVKEIGTSDLKHISIFDFFLAKDSNFPSKKVYLKSIP